MFTKKDTTFVIAEAGSNWKTKDTKSSIQRAKKMIITASKCGADAIKFQTYSPDGVYVNDAGKSDYLAKTGIKKSINQIFNDFSMPYEILPILSDFCKKHKIQFMSTTFSLDDAKAVNKFVKIHKIASYEINHIPLLKFIAKTKKPVIISTGASTLDEIDFAIKTLKKFGSKNICVLQCTACYPAPINSLNLSTISQLNKKYKISIGLSDHSIDPIIAPLVAIGYGAKVIEKHFTLNKNFAGPDHSFALNPEELKTMIEFVRKADGSKGTGKKEILSVEKELSIFAKRSLQATTKINKGDKLELGVNFEILRPGKRSRGIDPRFISKVNGKKSNSIILNGNGIRFSDIEN